MRPLSSSSRLTDRPGFALVGLVRIPSKSASPGISITRRLLLAILLLFGSALIVYLDRAGYRDAAGPDMSFLDCFYYTTVSLSTTGYGDIVPVTAQARLVNVMVITPLRILFLILLVGTTLSVLTERSRQAFTIQRWRRKVRDHYVVVGYGTKGKTAVKTMLSDGGDKSQFVIVDTDQEMLDEAAAAGFVTIHGSAAKSDVLRLAGVSRAKAVVVCTNRDDTAVLVTLTAREISPTATIVAAIHEAENDPLIRRSGADSVVVTSETAGRLLGLATATPAAVQMVGDLLTPEDGLAITERAVAANEIGRGPHDLHDIVIGVVRDGDLIRVGEPASEVFAGGDRLLVIRTP